MALTFKGMSLAGTAVKLNKRHELEFFMLRGKRTLACKRQIVEEQTWWYEDEDPIIRKTFEEECARSGAEVKMAPVAGRAN